MQPAEAQAKMSVVQALGGGAELEGVLEQARAGIETMAEPVTEPDAYRIAAEEDKLEHAKAEVRKVLLELDKRRQAAGAGGSVARWTTAGTALFILVVLFTAAVLVMWLMRADVKALASVSIISGLTTLVGLASKQLTSIDTAEANQRRVSEEMLLAWAKVETCESLDECRKVLDELNAPPADG